MMRLSLYAVSYSDASGARTWLKVKEWLPVVDEDFRATKRPYSNQTEW
jgi:hypothetical protein